MTLQELKNKIRNLGFDDDSIFTEYADIIDDAISRACKTIALTVKAPTGKLKLELKDSLGKTTTDIYVGSTANPVVINGESKTVSRYDVVLYEWIEGEGEKAVHRSQEFYFDGHSWQEVGRYDLAELSKDSDGNVLFESIDSVYIGNDMFLGYDVEDDHIFVVSTALSSDLTIYYNERIIPVTSDMQDDYQVQVVYQCEPLVDLLAAHYVWLDDDERKAILYWNEYDQLKQEIMAKSLRTRAKVIGGIRWLK